MSRDPLSRETLSHETLGNETLDSDEFESLDAVNDDHYNRSKPSKADSLRARRQVEAGWKSDDFSAPSKMTGTKKSNP
ncbi:PA3496 family putative envelope integrity protein [Halomonas sp. PA16-9]|uniref:PA3496 family putative envelope integrity protein n=1 Tax=Halomonas sp. PA16-9 TaxID=2576841 RepID=UPI003FA56A9C